MEEKEQSLIEQNNQRLRLKMVELIKAMEVLHKEKNELQGGEAL
jgi:hypothetical protein